MNSLFIIALAVAAGYAFKRYEDMKRLTAGTALTTSMVRDPQTGQLVRVAGRTIGYDPGGVSIYNTRPAANKPDQVVAALGDNPYSTNSGSPGYHPAFGGQENIPYCAVDEVV